MYYIKDVRPDIVRPYWSSFKYFGTWAVAAPFSDWDSAAIQMDKLIKGMITDCVESVKAKVDNLKVVNE